MAALKLSNRRNDKRRDRVRTRIRKEAKGRVRLSIYKSNNNIYAQLIDDATGKTLAAASTLDAALKKSLKHGGNKAAAEQVGKQIAEKGKKAGVSLVVFDRGGYLYHGCVQSLAEAARAGGLDF